jgi:carboxyl-protease-related protein|nr:S41 family peptidase [Segatella oris]
MKHFLRSILPLLLFLCASLLSGCVKEDEFANNPRGNFEALWRIIDEHYCFFDYKAKQYGLDWNDVYARYSKQIDGQMTEGQLFEVLGNMLGELRDGHVNMYTSFNIARNWSWRENYPSNVNDSLINRYLGTDYRISNGMKYRILDDNIGYIRCATFEYGLGSGNLNEILAYFLTARGLIIDIRNNGGGMISSAEELAARFTNDDILVGYFQHKTGRGHNDFSAMKEQWLHPSRGLRWQKPVVVLTNRGVYSAANEFVKYMKCCPNVKIVGDTTGGGAGLPFSSELPNGWSVRFSACPIYDKDGQSTEFGIPPDVHAGLNRFDFFSGIDTVIEQARKILK